MTSLRRHANEPDRGKVTMNQNKQIICLMTAILMTKISESLGTADIHFCVRAAKQIFDEVYSLPL